MTQQVPTDRRGGDRRIRQVYHEVERRDQSGRSDPRRRALERDRPSKVLWLAVVLLSLALVDALLWEGYYRQSLWVSAHDIARSTRAWSNGLWSGTNA